MPSKIKRVTGLPSLPARPAESHKGLYGHVLIIGGSSGMMGAAALATNAALRGGAGLVEFAAPACVQPHIAALCPCAISTPLACDSEGHLQGQALRQVNKRIEASDVIAIGPGLGVGVVQQNLVQMVLEQDKPVVIDADGLNNLAKINNWPALRKCSLVMTPHPGEFSRLTGRAVKDIQADREKIAVQAAQSWQQKAAVRAADCGAGGSPANTETANVQVVLLLKGNRTVVTDGLNVYINRTGNPGMASGGTGDVLTGLIAALIGQKLAPFEAACLGAHCHGRAGDLAAKKLGQVSLIATDLIDHLPKAMQEAALGLR